MGKAKQLKRIADLLDPNIPNWVYIDMEMLARREAEEDEYEQTHLRKKHWWSAPPFDA